MYIAALDPRLICIFLCSLPPLFPSYSPLSCQALAVFHLFLWHHTNSDTGENFWTCCTNSFIKYIWSAVTGTPIFSLLWVNHPESAMISSSVVYMCECMCVCVCVYASVFAFCLKVYVSASCPSGSIYTLSLSLWLFWLGSCVVLRRAEALI